MANPTFTQFSEAFYNIPGNEAYTPEEALDLWKKAYPKQQAAPVQEEQGDFGRGFKQGFTQLKQLGGGAAFALGDSLDMPGLAEWGLDIYKRGEEETQAQSRESDSFSNVMDGKGDFADFLQYAGGYVASQGLQAVATGGLGATGAKLVVGQALKGYAQKKAAEAIAKGVAKDVAEREAAQSLTAILGKAAMTGGATALGASNFAQETGEIYPGAAEQAKAEGREMDSDDRFRAYTSAAGAAALETLADSLGLRGVMKGGVGSSITGRVAREVPAGMVREGTTEAAQTAIETYGQGKPLEGEEFERGLVDSAALGAFGGGLVGGVASVRGQEPQVAQDPISQVAGELNRISEVEQRAAAETVSNIQAAGSIDEAIAAATAPTAADAERPSFDNAMRLSAQRAMIDREAALNEEIANKQGTPEGEALEQQRRANIPGGRPAASPEAEPAAAPQPEPDNPAARIGQPVPGMEAFAQFDTLRRMGVAEPMQIVPAGGGLFRLNAPEGVLQRATAPRETQALPAPPMSGEFVVDSQGTARQATQEELGGLGGRNITRIPRAEFATPVAPQLPAPVRQPALPAPVRPPALANEMARPTSTIAVDQAGTARAQTQQEQQAVMAERMRRFELGKSTPRGQSISTGPVPEVETVAPAPREAAVAAPANISKPAAQQVERRADPTRRRTVAEMSPDEMRRELLTSDLTGLSNRRAYDEAPKRAVQTSIDADSLKWVNDNLGHEAGDKLLSQVGKAIQAAGAEGYHISGDEFRIQADSTEDAESLMKEVQKRLDKVKVRGKLPDGTVITKQGIGVSYGHGKDTAEAERNLQRHKSDRERSGLRPGRGAEPPGVRRSEPRQEDSSRGGRADEGVSTVAAGGNADRGNGRERPAEKPAKPVTKEKPVETYAGLYGKGMAEFPASQELKRRQKVQPALDWRVEPFGDVEDRFQVAGYEKDKPAEKLGAATSKFRALRDNDKISFGPGGARYITRLSTARGNLFHETGIENLESFLQDDISGGVRPANFYAADNPDIALGQGARGVLIEFRKDGLSGREHAKPGTGDIAGREFVINGASYLSIASVVLPADAKISATTKRLLAYDFTQEVLPDGRTHYVRKGGVSQYQADIEKKSAGLESLPRKSEVLDGFVRGDIPGIGDAHAAPAPEILKRLGAQSETLVVPDSVVSDKALFRHGVSEKSLRNLLAEITRPVMVFDSETVPNALVFLTEIKNVMGRPVVVAIHVDHRHQQRGRTAMVINRIATITQKDSPENAIGGWIKRGLLRYEDKAKRPGFLQPAVGSNSIPSGATSRGDGQRILGPADLVKPAESRPREPVGKREIAGRTRAYQQRAATIMKEWRGAQDLNVQVVATTDDVPEPYRPSPMAEGVYHAEDGRVFLIAENLPTQKRMEEVLTHEVIGHYGVESLLGEQFNGVVRDLKRLEPARWQESAADYSDQPDHIIAREVMARMAEDNVRPAFFERLYAMIRQALRKLGVRLDYSNADLKRIIEDAGRFVRTGKSQDGDMTDALRGVAYESRARAGVKQQARDALSDLFATKKTFGLWSKTVGTQYAKAQQDEDFAKVYNEAQAYVDDVSHYANEAADQAPTILPKLAHWTDAFKGIGADISGARKADVNAASAAIFDGTLSYKVFTDAELRSQFKLTDPQIKLYREFRAAVDKSLDSLGISELARMARTAGADQNGIKDAKTTGEALAAFNAAVDDPAMQEAAFERVARVDELKEQGYAPLMRFGRHAVYATRGEEQLSFHMFDSEREANRFARELRNDPEMKGADIKQNPVSEEAYKLFQGINPDTLELFGETATIQQIEDDGSIRTVALKDNPAYQAYLKLAVANRSSLKRLIKRKGVAGYSEDAPRVLASFITSNARATSANYHMAEMSKAATLDIPKGKGDVQDEAVKLITYLRNPNEEAAKLRGFMFINFMGGSVASALVNMTQPVLMTMPYLSQWGAGKASAALVKGAKVAVRGASGELGEAMKKAAEAGITEPHEIHNLYAESMRNFGSNMGWRRFLKIWGSFFSAAEAFNRKATFAAAWDVAQGLSGAQLAEAGVTDAFGFAVKAVHETQGVYSRANRPNWARGAVGATLFTFKQYSIAYLEFLYRLPKAQRIQALALLVAVSGLNGLPFGDDLDDLIDALAQHLGYNWSTKEKKREWAAMLLGKEGAEMALSGLSAIPGVPLDVQGRLGMGNLIPGTGVFKRSNADPARDVLEVAGPAGALAKSAVESSKALMSGEFAQALEGMAPTAIKNAVKMMDMLNTGLYRDTRGRKIIDTEFSDAVLKGIGFQPSSVAKVSRVERSVQESVALNKTVEADIAEKWAAGVFEKNNAKVREAMQELRDWNEDNPESRIRVTPQQISKRVKAMQTTRSERIIKGTPRELRGVVAEELRP